MKLISIKVKKNNSLFRHRFIAGLLCILVGVSVFSTALSWARVILIDGVELRLSPMKIPEDPSGDGDETRQIAQPGEDGDDDGDSNPGEGGNEDDDVGGNRGSSGAGAVSSGGGASSGSKVSKPTVDSGDDADAGSVDQQDDTGDGTGAIGTNDDDDDDIDDLDETVFEIWSYDLVDYIGEAD